MKPGKKNAAKGIKSLNAKQAGQVRGGATANAQMTFKKGKIMSGKRGS